MRIARFVSTDGRTLYGRISPDGRSAEPLAGELFSDLRFASASVGVTQLLPPCEPPNIFAIGRNYRAHAKETGSEVPEAPMIFQKPTTSLNQPGGTIVLPASAPAEVDFEAELAVVIGRKARCISPEQALDHVLGYTCANDVSARDCQRKDKQWSRAKGFDTFCPLGPWLVTADEIDPTRVRVQSRLNGNPMQDANTSDMIFPVRALVSYLSHQFTLLPGTVILTGTPEGVGMARTPPVFLKLGDRVEVELSGIGTLANVVAAPSA